MKHAISETIRGSIPKEENAQKYLAQVAYHFVKNEKANASTILGDLVLMRYKGKGNIREYIMEMSNLAAKLRSLKPELSKNIQVHLVLISLPAQFSQFKVSYNTQKDKWTLNKLISHCVQEVDRLKQERTESAYLENTS